MKHLKYSGFLALGLIALPIMGAQAETVWSGNQIIAGGVKPIYSNMPTPADLPGDKFKPIGVLPPIYDRPIERAPSKLEPIVSNFPTPVDLPTDQYKPVGLSQPIYEPPIAPAPAGLDPIVSNMPTPADLGEPIEFNPTNTWNPKLGSITKHPPLTALDGGEYSNLPAPAGLGSPEYSNFPTPISAELGDDTHPVLYNEGYFDQSDVASSSDVKEPSISTSPVKEALYDDGGGVITPNNAQPLAPIRNVSSDMPKLSKGLVAAKDQRYLAAKSSKVTKAGTYKVATGEIKSQWNAE